jgi:hypothetical protein
MAYEKGFRLPDPDAKDGGKDIIMPVTSEQVLDQLMAHGTEGLTHYV